MQHQSMDFCPCEERLILRKVVAFPGRKKSKKLDYQAVVCIYST